MPQSLAVNVTSSGSLTTAATTKGSDFGATHGVLTSNTPQRGGAADCIMTEVVVPPRPTNTSRVFHDG